MVTISLHATPHHGGRGKFRVSGEAYGKDRTGSEHIYDRIRLAVDGSEVDLYLDRSQVKEIRTALGEFLRANPPTSHEPSVCTDKDDENDSRGAGRHWGKAVTAEEIELPATYDYARDLSSTDVVPAGTDCRVTQHVWSKYHPGVVAVHMVGITVTVDGEERDTRVPIQKITFNLTTRARGLRLYPRSRSPARWGLAGFPPSSSQPPPPIDITP